MSAPIDDILVIKFSALGDVLMAFPAFARIRAAHPAARITLLTTPLFAGLAGASPYFDRVESDGRPGDLVGWLRLVWRLRRARYQRVYDLQTNDRTNLLFQALRPRPPAWSGVAEGCALPHRNKARMTMHSLERHAEQLMHAGIWPDAPVRPGAGAPPDLGWILAGQPAEATAKRAPVVLIPGSAPHRPEKRWPANFYGVLAERLVALGHAVVIVGTAPERPLADAIRRRAPGARDLTGTTSLEQLAALGARAALVVGNDTGPTHLLAAAGAPTLVLFSSASDPALSAPRGAVRVLRAPRLENLPLETVLAAALAGLESSPRENSATL